MDCQFLSTGRTWEYTPSGADVSAGDVVVIGKKVTVAVADISDGVAGTVYVSGIIKMPKGTGSSSAITQGARCYWDAVNEETTTTAGGNTYAGLCARAAAAADSTVEVDIGMTGDMVA